MNTSKQVNVMIGLLFVAFLTFGAYIVNEGNRAASAREHQDELFAKRGATLYVANCRGCHGLEGKGQEEGGIAPALDRIAFRVLGEENEFDAVVTPEGDAQTVRNFLFETISCGRTNTAMPVWSEKHGGPMSETQVNYLVHLITTGRWDLVKEIGHEHDAETGDTKDTILVKDPKTLSLTTKNCGQFNQITAADLYERDPSAVKKAAGGGSAPAAEKPKSSAGGDGPKVKGAPVATFFQASCATCHGQQRQGLIGPALTPQRLTQADDFYFNTIKNGRPGTAMPAWGAQGLTDDDVKALVTFIKTVNP